MHPDELSRHFEHLTILDPMSCVRSDGGRRAGLSCSIALGNGEKTLSFPRVLLFLITVYTLFDAC